MVLCKRYVPDTFPAGRDTHETTLALIIMSIQLAFSVTTIHINKFLENYPLHFRLRSESEVVPVCILPFILMALGTAAPMTPAHREFPLVVDDVGKTAPVKNDTLFRVIIIEAHSTHLTYTVPFLNAPLTLL